MASDVMTLFNMPSQQELGQRYLESRMISPAQMGNQGLLQQVVSLGGNAGAGLGYAAGRLLGGATPEQVRAKGIEESMMKVQGMGFNSDAEMYSALSKELAARGLTQDAFMANKEARAAMREEQVMKKGGIDLETATFNLEKSKEEAKLLEVQIAEAEALGPAGAERAKGLKRQLEAKERASALVEAQIKAQEATAKAQLMNAGANAERVASDKISGNLEVTYPNLPGSPPIRARIGAPLANGKIVGQGTGKQYTQEEWANGGMITEENAVKARLGIGQTTTPDTTKPAAKARSGPLPTARDFYYTEGQ